MKIIDFIWKLHETLVYRKYLVRIKKLSKSSLETIPFSMCETCDVTFDSMLDAPLFRLCVCCSREREVDERSLIKDEIEKATEREYSRCGRSD